MDSRDIFGAYLCPDRPNDDKFLLFFFEILVKNGHLTKMAQTAKMVYFCYFFPFFCISGVSHL